tara:strand:+ start:6715 stop:10239 length:3525 start_codon:yes stop_codon:yes gene_type:complete
VLLNKIRLSGFKSFVDPTEIHFSTPLTGVVGPNGCGKSNIVDAVKWVLGESRTSELRGDHAKDVIFSGSNTRPAAGRASVELLLNNSSGQIGGLWGSYTEISVQRVLDSSGNSSSLINGQLVRRKDVLDLFLGTGLGPKAYAIVGQGSISKIIESKPDELRLFLEEAAGVSKYRTRRRETESRLKESRLHLDRVSDIIKELDDRLENLEIHAKKAERYHFKCQEKAKLEFYLLGANYVSLSELLEKEREEIKKENSVLDHMNFELTSINSEVFKLREERANQQRELDKINELFFHANSEILAREKEDHLLIQKLEQATSSFDFLTIESKKLLNMSGDDEVKLSDSINVIEELEREIRNIKLTVDDLCQEMEPVQLSSKEYTVKLTEQKTQSALLEAESSNLIEKNEALQGMIRALDDRKKVIENELNDISLVSQDSMQQLDKKKKELTSITSDLETNLKKNREEFNDKELQLVELRSSIETSQGEIISMEAQLSSLTQMQEKSLKSEGINEWLRKNRLDGRPTLISLLKVEAEWKLAVEVALANKLGAVKLENIEELSNILQNDPNIIGHFFYEDAQKQIDGLKKNNQSLADAIISDNFASKVAKKNLQLFFKAQTVNKAMQLSVESDMLHGKWITPRGTIVSKNEIFIHSDDENDSVISREEEILNLASNIKERQLELEVKKNKFKGLEHVVANLKITVSNFQVKVQKNVEALHEIEMRLVVAKQKNEDLLIRQERLKGEFSQVLKDKNKKVDEKNLVGTFLEKNEEELAESISSQNLMERELYEIMQSLELKNKKLKNAQERIHLLSLELRAKEEYSENLKSRVTDLRDRKSELDSRIESIILQKKSINTELEKSNISELTERKNNTEKLVSLQKQKLLVSDNVIKRKESEKEQLSAKITPVSERIRILDLGRVEVEIKKQQLEGQLKEIEAKGFMISEVGNFSTGEIKSMEKKLKRINSEIEALGPINLAATDEIKELTKRKEVLAGQIEDISCAEKELIQAIKKIDSETKELLRSTHSAVNKNLGIFFPKIFGGGLARLELDGEEILDSGLQFFAQLPGKKTSSIKMLSGGEKALAAISLIFAFFQLNPAPFCLLDEVDAPLDEANTDRLNIVIKDLSDNTQFIFVTHNKASMEISDQLVGITMVEPGVSKVVSVDLASAVSETESLSAD